MKTKNSDMRGDFRHYSSGTMNAIAPKRDAPAADQYLKNAITS
jgi:hypothetical protein